MVYYRILDNKIIDFANFKYSVDCKETDKKIIKGFDGSFIFEEESKTSEYLNKKNIYNRKNEINIKINELKTKLAKLDYIGVKIATGRGTREEYAKEIELMTFYANEINNLEKELTQLS